MTAQRPRKSFYQKHESVHPRRNGVLLITLIVWQALWSAGKISPLFMSGPSAIAKRFWDDLLHGHLLQDFAYSGKNFVIGFVLAAVVGRRPRRPHRLVQTARNDHRPVHQAPLRHAARGHGSADHHLVRDRHVVEGLHRFHLGLLPDSDQYHRRHPGDRPRSAQMPRARSAPPTARSSPRSRFPAQCRSSSPAFARAWLWA